MLIVANQKGCMISGVEKFATSMLVFEGSLNTDRNCFCNRSAISLGWVRVTWCSSNSMLMLLFFFENFLA